MSRTTSRTIVAGFCVAALTLTGCGSDDDKASDTTTTTKVEATTTTAAAAELELTDVWARQSPMGTTAGAIYLSITSPVDDELVGASVPATVAGKTEIHETVLADDGGSDTSMGDGNMTTTTAMGGSDMSTTTAMGGSDMSTTTAMGSGTMTMRPVESIKLPKGTKVELKPGGYHIMLLELVKPLEVGDKIELTLTFTEAGEKTVTAEVRES